jgi:hypothetical protein
LSIIDYLANMVLSNSVGIAIGLIGFVLASVFYYKSKKTKKPRYAINSYNIISGFEAKTVPLDIRYAGEKVECVTVSKVAFWNAGNETLNGTDVATSDPITLQVLRGCRILGVSRIYIKNKANNIEYEKQGESSVPIRFEFIDKGEGAVFQLVHTGKSSSDVCVSGTVKGAGKPITPQRRLIGLVVSGLILLVGIASIPYAFLQAENIKQPTMFTTMVMNSTTTVVPSSTVSPVWFLPAVVPSIVLLATMFFVGIAWSRLRWERVPEGFSAFEEEIQSKGRRKSSPSG